MTLTNKEIAEAFSRHNFEKTFPFIADSIQWNMVGGELILGKKNVFATCNKSSSYLKTAKTSFAKFLVLDNGGDYVTIDTISKYIDPDGNVSKVASCDIYMFENGQLVEITSYCIELDKEN